MNAYLAVTGMWKLASAGKTSWIFICIFSVLSSLPFAERKF